MRPGSFDLAALVALGCPGSLNLIVLIASGCAGGLKSVSLRGWLEKRGPVQLNALAGSIWAQIECPNDAIGKKKRLA